MARTEDSSSEKLIMALDGALGGKSRALWDLLARSSGLPGVRANTKLLEQFAELAAGRGKRADATLLEMATLDADVARGGTEYEFVPMCGVLAVGYRAAAHDASYAKLMTALHGAADDFRFRVREAVPLALARVGAMRGDLLLAEVEGWMDGFFHAAAVLQAMSSATWSVRLDDAALVVTRIDQSFALLESATRSAARYPGHKALVESLSTAPGVLAARFGVPIFDLLTRRATTMKDPQLRETLEKNLGGSRLAGRHASEVARVRKALTDSTPARRDPLTYVGPTRGRGKPKR